MLNFILRLKFEDLMRNEFGWISLLKHCINGRFNVGVQLHECRTIRVQKRITNKRLDEIEQHRVLLERHIKVILEYF